MARFRRKDLKRDRFVEEVSHQVEFFSAYRKQIIGGGVAGLVLIAAISGYFAYSRSRSQDARSELLKALESYHGVVSAESIPGVKIFDSKEERFETVSRELDAVVLEYGGTAAATGAAYYAGLLDREEGNLTEAKAHFEQAIRGSGDEYAALAHLALGGLLMAEGNAEAARDQFQQVVDNPTRTAPSEIASLEVARTFLVSDPQKAKEILEAINEQSAMASTLTAALLEKVAESE